MNAIRFGLYTGILWAGAALFLVEISILNSDSTAWVELDFRFLTSIVLIILNALGVEANISSLIHYVQFGMPINALNTIIALITGFIDGYISGFFIAIFYNFLSIISEGRRFPTTIKFGIAVGIVFGICSGLLALNSMLYSFEITSFDFAVRPLFLISEAIPASPEDSIIQAARNSYIIFPNSYAGALGWGLWGFIDGLIGGVLLSLIFLKIRERLKR